MSRPADWAPLAAADPVPGDPMEVASIGGQLTKVAEQISADVAWLRSLCTAQFWDSGAGEAFAGQVDAAAAKLARAHERYLAAGQALGTSPAASAGYAAALDQAQALSLRARAQGQAAWAAMRSQLAAVEVACQGRVPWADLNLYESFYPAQPLLDQAGRPVLMSTPATASAPVATSVARYNASALDYRTAHGWLAEAVAMRDQAAASAAAAIQAALGDDGLQNQTGLWHDITASADAAFGWTEQHWAQVVADIANVCGWIATALGVLALIFAFICPPLAAALESMALTLTELAAVCHLILALFAHGSWMDVGLDLIGLATFGLGRSLLRAGKTAVEAVDEISAEGAVARAETMSAGLTVRGSSLSLTDLTSLVGEADDAELNAITDLTKVKPQTGLLGALSKISIRDFVPRGPGSLFKVARETDWESVLGKQPFRTIREATWQALRFRSPEIDESLKELNEIQDVGKLSKVAGVNFADNITHYGHLWRRSQVIALGSDITDKIDSVLNHFHINIPGYDWAKERAAT
jgi:hypothetical protein